MRFGSGCQKMGVSTVEPGGYQSSSLRLWRCDFIWSHSFSISISDLFGRFAYLKKQKYIDRLYKCTRENSNYWQKKLGMSLQKQRCVLSGKGHGDPLGAGHALFLRLGTDYLRVFASGKLIVWPNLCVLLCFHVIFRGNWHLKSQWTGINLQFTPHWNNYSRSSMLLFTNFY